MNILFLERYNNYANRIIKTKEQFIGDFIASQARDGKQTFLLENVNFNPNDNITTSFVVGDTQTKTWPDWVPDYCVVYDPDAAVHPTPSSTYYPIISTWFVLEQVRLRGRQYRLDLKRDVIRDNYDTIKTSDIFVEKAMLDDSNNLIFNSEGQKFNQIKQSEYLLKDATQSQWLVGYVVQDHQDHTDLTATYASPPSGSLIQWSSIPVAIRAFMDKSAGAAGKNTNIAGDYAQNVSWRIAWMADKQIQNFFGVDRTKYLYLEYDGSMHWYDNDESSNGSDGNPYEPAMHLSGSQYMKFNPENWDQANWDGINDVCNQMALRKALLVSYFLSDTNLTSYATYVQLLNYNGKTIYDATTGYYYKVKVTAGPTNQRASLNYSYNTTSNVKTTMRTCFTHDLPHNGYTFNTTTSSTGRFFNMSVMYFTCNVVLEQQGQYGVKWSLPGQRKQLFHEPYDMFCIPFSNFQCKNWVTDKEAGMAACRAIAASGVGSSNALVYDIQLLPYCPLPNVIRGTSVDETLLTQNVDYTYVYDQQTNVKKSIVFWCSDSDFTFDIPLRLDSTNPKIDNECDVWRLCSPNYEGLFEFSVAKNRGVTYFNVDCSYKPFQPYIHINPDFDAMYGNDFNDSRGLVCGGDFSLALATNAWEQYKLQNKNYQAIFDRGIQKLDADYTTDLVTDSIKAVNNSAMAGIEGYSKGVLWDKAITAGVYAAGSLINDMADIGNMTAKHIIEKDYQRDMFNFQNGNVQALPNSLAKTDPFTANNKKWPFVEYYTCTDEEREALENKIKFNGMTVNKIDKLQYYIKPGTLNYFKGELIRDNFIIEDSHTVDAIYSELKKGVYI